MKWPSLMSLRLTIFLLLFIFFTQDVHAYLDLGTGSYILQMLIAGIFGGILAIKIFWTKIKTTTKNIFSKEKKDG